MMAMAGSLPTSFKMALPKPMGDLTNTMSIFYTVYGWHPYWGYFDFLIVQLKKAFVHL